MRKGFTLVELSIVLVVIGLLIGGVLVAQSMINTAKIQSFIRRVNEVDVAVNNFQTRYKSLPGDSTLISPAGNGDDMILDSAGEFYRYDGELASFWGHLSASGFAPGTQFTSVVSGSELDITLPVVNYYPAGIERNASIGAGYVIDDGANGIGHDGYSIGLSTYDNYYFIARQQVTFGEMLFSSAIKPSDALAIDTKIDDALPYSGDVIAEDGGMSNGCRTGGYFTNTPYRTTTTIGCALYIKFGF